MRQALSQALEARMQILNVMLSAIPEPRAELSPYAPRIETLHINPDKIGAIIGPGGKMIRSIQEKTNTKIDIADDGTVFIAAETPTRSEARRLSVPGERDDVRERSAVAALELLRRMLLNEEGA